MKEENQLGNRKILYYDWVMKNIIYAILFMISFLVFVFYNMSLLKIEEESFRDTQRVIIPAKNTEIQTEEGVTEETETEEVEEAAATE